MTKFKLTGDDAVALLKHTGSVTLLSRVIKYDGNPYAGGKVISDTIIDRVNGTTYPTGGKNNTKTR